MSAIASDQFQLVKEKGWRRGLGNLLQGEYSAWFKSSKWWKHLAMWFSIINLMMLILILASTKIAQEGGEMPEPIFMYGIFGGMFVAFGVMIIMQRVLIAEKQLRHGCLGTLQTGHTHVFCRLPVGCQFDRHPAHLGDRAWCDLLYNPGILVPLGGFLPWAILPVY